VNRRGFGWAVATGVAQVASLAVRRLALSVASKPDKAAHAARLQRRHVAALQTLRRFA
jgi:hypothetical protein